MTHGGGRWPYVVAILLHLGDHHQRVFRWSVLGENDFVEIGGGRILQRWRRLGHCGWRDRARLVMVRGA